MVKLRIQVMMCAIALVLMSACSSSESTPTGSTTASTMSAKVNGTSWVSTVTGGTNDGDGGMIITGSYNGVGISLGLTEARTPGEYKIGTPNVENVASVTESATKLWMAGDEFGSGSVTFTKLTSTDAEGTFTVTLVPSPLHPAATGNKVITEGKFSVKFTK